MRHESEVGIIAGMLLLILLLWLLLPVRLSLHLRQGVVQIHRGLTEYSGWDGVDGVDGDRR